MRAVLNSIVDWLTRSNFATNERRQQFEELQFLFHLLVIRTECREQIASLHWRQCLCLLSFSDWIRCDVLFKDAGDSSKAMDADQDAFIFYNHFVDICDGIDDPNDEIDYADLQLLAGTDCAVRMAIPHKIVPTKHIYAKKEREQIRDWVLEQLATAETDPTLSCLARNCDGRQLGDKCIVTGAVLFDSDSVVKCRECQRRAVKSAWNLYVDKFKICPWCQKAQAPIY